MSPTEHARAQPEGRARAKPGTKGEGKYYRIVVRPKERKNLLPLGTTMLDDQDMYKDLQAKDQVSHGMIKHGSLAKKIPILRLET